ncbi:hypothetical protein F4813DRAFT_266526 [Daldinia decipiens]|uniref:uncharacterized protein n=1 Tax=Daldinia decipiens TaxID=326647 RepID=UPI0020C440BF|nr:uncharacterized protein F4813DRAFT_266526 [Daldinia decipiens]KAI1660875.1 hypothetical protein F4813DRAFT_266526 [Daldinia decipiens]
MDKLPPEILLHILEFTVIALYGNKNNLLRLRATCKLFNEVLKPFALRTLQLEFTRLDRTERRLKPPDYNALRRIGPLCQALYLDMMVVRDDSEVGFLGSMFAQIPAMDSFVSRLRNTYCMNDYSFTEIDYRYQLGRLLEQAPNVTAVKLNLPFQLVSPGPYSATTMILGNTFEALAQRPEESETLRTLVLENLTDRSIASLWRNPQDVKNIIGAFRDLRHLFLSVRRNEEERDRTINFRNRLWEMIGKAERLESLCLADLDVNEKHYWDIKTSSQRDSTLEEWQFKSIPTIHKPPKSVLPNLTHLELWQVEVMGCGLLSVLKCFGDSLKELFLDGVYLKTVYSAESPQDVNSTLWIGLPNVRPPPNHRWVATYLRQIRAQLRVCRVANLGYDQYVMSDNPLNSAEYDTVDPCGLGRCLEQRFVEVATGVKQPAAPDGSPVAYFPEEGSQESWAQADRERPADGLRIEDWNVKHYMATRYSPTSSWQRSIDGLFPNCNQFTLNALNSFADSACTGMTLLKQLHDHENELSTSI